MSDKFKALNRETQQVELLSEDQLEQAVLSEKYGLPKDVSIDVISPDGSPGQISSNEAVKAFQNGFKLERFEDRANRLRTKAAENAPIQSFAEGTGSGLSFGLTDQALKALGADEKDLAARRDTISGTAGEIAGVVAPMLVTGGATGVAKGALSAGKAIKTAGSAVRGVDKAARATEKVLETALKKVGSEAGNKAITQKLAKNLVSRGAGGAVEGAAYGAGEIIREDALGTAELNAESLLASVGAGAVLGGAIGSAFGGIEALAPIAGKAAGKVKEKAGKYTRRYTDPEFAAGELAGLTPRQISELKEVNPRLLTENKAFIEENMAGVMQSGEDLANTYKRVHRESGNKIGKLIKNIDEALEVSGQKLSRDEVYRPVVSSFDEIIDSYKDSPGFSGFLPGLKESRDKYQKLMNLKSPLKVSELQKFRRQADELIKHGKHTKDLPLIQQALTKARRSLRSSIDNIAEKASNAGPGFENLAKDLKKANRDFFVTSYFKKKIGKKVDASQLISYADIVSTGIGYAAGGTLGVVLTSSKKLLDSDFRRKLVVMKSIEKGQKALDKSIDAAVGSLKKAGKAAKIVTVKSLIDMEIAKDPKTGSKPKTQEQAYKNTIRLLNKFEQEPELAMKRVTGAAARVNQAAPNTAAAAQDTLVRAMGFLNSKKPVAIARGGVLDMLKSDVRIPSTTEIAKFKNYVQVVNDPKVAFEQMSNGELTRESVEALKAVYPAIYAKMQSKIMDTISEDPDAIPYSKRIQLGILLDVPADMSLLPQNVMALQQNFIPEEEDEKQVGAVKPTQSGLNNLGQARREMTDTQKVRNV